MRESISASAGPGPGSFRAWSNGEIACAGRPCSKNATPCWKRSALYETRSLPNIAAVSARVRDTLPRSEEHVTLVLLLGPAFIHGRPGRGDGRRLGFRRASL